MIRVKNKREWIGKGEYVGRGTPLGNPYIMKNESQRESVIAHYRIWLKYKMTGNNKVSQEMKRLAVINKQEDLNLVCWCSPKVCHADIIKEYLEIRFWSRGFCGSVFLIHTADQKKQQNQQC